METPHPRSFDLVEGTLFQLELIDETLKLENDDDLHMEIKNISDHELWFQKDLNLIVMDRTSENSFYLPSITSDSFGDTPVILGKAGSSNDTYDFSFSLDLLPFDNLYEFEVYVGGYAYENGKICHGQYRAMLPITIDKSPDP